MKVDMYDGEPYDKKRHMVTTINWSDGRMTYWGWIYARGGRGRVVGDFAARTVREAEKYFGIRFTVK